MASRNYMGFGEAQVLPTTGATNFFLQQIERNRQNELALDKQIADSLSKYDPSKIRDQDMEGYYSRYQKLKDLMVRNRDVFKNPLKNVDKIREIDEARNSLASFINTSKGAKEFQKQVDDFYTKNAGKVQLDDFIAKRNLLASPIDSEGWNKRPLNITDFQFKKEDFNPGAFYDIAYKANPMKIVSSVSTRPDGLMLTNRKSVRDAAGLANTIRLQYDSNWKGAKNYFDEAFAELTPEEKSYYEKTLQPYYPGFEVNTPADLAVARGAVGKIELDMGASQTGYTQSAREASQKRVISFSASVRDAMDQRREARAAARKSAKESQWTSLMSGALRTGDRGVIDRYISELDDVSPGVSYGYINMGTALQSSDPTTGLRDAALLKDIERNAASAKDAPTAADVNKGILYIKVPNKKGDGYKYLITSPARGNIDNALNRMLNAARGTKKFLNDNYPDVYEEDALSVPDLDDSISEEDE